MEIKFKRLSDKAVAPVKSTVGSAAFDLTCTDVTTEINEAGELILVYCRRDSGRIFWYVMYA